MGHTIDRRINTFVNSISHSTVMYSLYLRERIVRLYDSGLHGMALVRIQEKEGFKVTKSGVHYVIKKYQRTGIIFNLQGVEDLKYCLMQVIHKLMIG